MSENLHNELYICIVRTACNRKLINMDGTFFVVIPKLYVPYHTRRISTLSERTQRHGKSSTHL